MERLKVLFITMWYPSKQDPVLGVFVREHAKAVRLYEDVVVLHCCGPDPEYDFKRLWRMEKETDPAFSEGIPTYRLWHMPMPVLVLRDLLRVWSAFRAFQRLAARGFRPDVIHAHLYPAGVAAIAICKLYGTPMVLTEHSTPILQGELSAPARRRLRLALRVARMALPVSSALAHALRQHGEEGKIRVVPNTINTGRYQPTKGQSESDSGTKRVLMIACVVPRKGVPLLLEAVHTLRQRRTDFVVDIAGDGPFRLEYERLAAALGLGGIVTFHGLVTEQQKIELLRRCDFFVLPSSWENFGVVLGEAIACGKPVVATAQGGPREFVTDEVGVMAPPGNREALRGAVEYMLDHHREYNPSRLAEYARRRFGYDTIGAQFDRVYRRVLDENQRHGDIPGR